MIKRSIKRFKKLILTIVFNLKNQKRSFLNFYKDVMNYYAKIDPVFTHNTIDIIEECFANVYKIMHKNPLFFATYNEGSYQNKKFYLADPYIKIQYPFKLLKELGEKYGLKAELIDRDLGSNNPNYKCLKIALR